MSVERITVPLAFEGISHHFGFLPLRIRETYSQIRGLFRGSLNAAA